MEHASRWKHFCRSWDQWYGVCSIFLTTIYLQFFWSFCLLLFPLNCSSSLWLHFLLAFIEVLSLSKLHIATSLTLKLGFAIKKLQNCRRNPLPLGPFATSFKLQLGIHWCKKYFRKLILVKGHLCHVRGVSPLQQSNEMFNCWPTLLVANMLLCHF